MCKGNGEYVMGIIVDREKCIRCGLCVEICPEDILVMEENVKVVYPEECCWCGACEIDCPEKAIKVRYTRQVGPVFVRREEV